MRAGTGSHSYSALGVVPGVTLSGGGRHVQVNLHRWS